MTYTADSEPGSRKINLEVAILGGGFTGVNCAQQLGKRLDVSLARQCGLISEHNYMVFQPLLAEAVGASISPQHVVNPIRLLCPEVETYRGEVTRVDLKNNEIQISAGEFSQNFHICFRHLVLALGAEIDLSRVPGMPEHALVMQNEGDAMILRATILSRIEEANIEMNEMRRRSLLTFVVVGGGYSGVETAGEILDMLHSMVPLYSRISLPEIRVVLVHSRDYILPTMNRDLSEYAMKQLRSRGLELVLGRRVKAMTSTRVYLDDGQVLETTTTVSTVGNAPHRLLTQMCRQYNLPNERGRIRVTPDLRVEGFPNLWAAGDCAMVPLSGKAGDLCPPTAQFAMRQGALCGDNIANTLQGRPLKTFAFKGLGELASIGHRTAVANILGFQMSGFPAWFLWRTLYLSKLPGWERRLRVVIDWTLDLFFPRDITLLNPRYTRLQKEMHLEPGDTLFCPGEPAFSLYVLKSGRIHLVDKDKVVRVIEAGEYFGERALLHGGNYIFTAVAAEASQLISVSGQYFLPMVHESRKLSLLFARTSAQSNPQDELSSLASKIPDGLIDTPLSQVMVHPVVSISATESIHGALSIIKSNRFSTFPLVDQENRIVSCIMEDDFFNALKRPEIQMDSNILAVDKTQIPLCQPTDSVRVALDKMVYSGRTKCFVTQPDGTLVGVLAILDLFKK